MQLWLQGFFFHLLLKRTDYCFNVSENQREKLFHQICDIYFKDDVVTFYHCTSTDGDGKHRTTYISRLMSLSAVKGHVMSTTR